MKKKFSKKSIEPRPITIRGEEYPAMLSMAAMAEIEDETGQPFTAFFAKLSRNESTVREQLLFICACLHAGGTEVTMDDLFSLDALSDFPDVLNQIIGITNDQAPEGDEKNPEM